MKILVLLCFVLVITACDSDSSREYTEEDVNRALAEYNFNPDIIEKEGVVLTQITNIPPFKDVSLKLIHHNVNFRQGENELEFVLDKFSLGQKTARSSETSLTEVDDGQYFVTVGKNIKKNLTKQITVDFNKGNNSILAFLCRSYGVSVKSEKAFVFKNIEINQENLGKHTNNINPFLFLNLPKEKQKTVFGKPILLDFYLVNVKLNENGNYVELKIDDQIFKLFNWSAYKITGLKVGKHELSLQVFNSKGHSLKGELLKETKINVEVTEGLIF